MVGGTVDLIGGFLRRNCQLLALIETRREPSLARPAGRFSTAC
jgi:hypothetical protein